MTHEVKHIFEAYQKTSGAEAAVLATVVALDGSSYRRPGVCMLIFESGAMVGAVSGGCVEKEVFRQAQSVFETGISKVMIYDGRYRLGCEGILYILLETFKPDRSFLESFERTLQNRETFTILSYFEKAEAVNPWFGSVFQLGDETFSISPNKKSEGVFQTFEQKMHPCFQLMIIGAEHDAVQLCKYATMTGWEVTVVTQIQEEKSQADFPGAQKLLQVDPSQFTPNVDDQTAIMIMTHSFVKDLQYVSALRDTHPMYIGLLGPFKRREKLFDELLERFPDISEEFLDGIYGPAGLDIGAETPQEIALSILSEILTVKNQKSPITLRDKMGKIHL